MTIRTIYPASRANASNCTVCKNKSGRMVDSGRVSLQNSTGGFIDLMRWTCFRCGYTIFFDIDAARNCPFDGSADEEIFPE